MLLDLALHESNNDRALANRHAAIAWKLSTKFNVRVAERRFLFCHKCKRFIVPTSARFRLSRKRKGLSVTCLMCSTTYHKMF